MRQMQISRHGQDHPSRFSQVSWYNDFLKTFSAIFKLERKPRIHLEIQRALQRFLLPAFLSYHSQNTVSRRLKQLERSE